MIQNIQIIAREALKNLLKEGKDPTPEAYGIAFSAEAKKMGIVIEDTHSLEYLLGMLESEVKESLFNRKFKNKDELTLNLIKMINQFFFYKKSFALAKENRKLFLRLLSTAPQKEIQTLAKANLLEIDKLNFQSLQTYKERWSEIVRKNPTLDSSDPLLKVLETLAAMPIEDEKFLQWQKEVTEYLKAPKEGSAIPNALFKKFESLFKKSLEHNAHPAHPTHHAPKPKESKPVFPDIHSLSVDSATMLIAKEGMNKVLDFAEMQYQNQNQNYAVIIFGIAHYSQLLADYGIEAANKVLATLGRLLKQFSNESDLIAHYSKEEFLTCLLGRDKQEAIDFVRKLDEIISKSTFMYKQTQISIQLTAQASHRVDKNSLEEMLKMTLEEFIKHKDSQGIIHYGE